MPTRLRLALLLFFALALAAPGWSPAPVAARADPSSPALAAQQARSALFDAQAALLAGNRDEANAALADARAALDPLLPEMTADPESAETAQAGLADAEAAVRRGDATALAMAQGRVWAALLAGGYAETLAAIGRGDADAAAAWLLLRDFRPTTRFARPNADATLAVRQLKAGQIAPEAAAEAVRADLLDTYQARLDTTLTAAAAAKPGAVTAAQAEGLGEANALWALLAPSYRQQLGADARAQADTAFANLAAAARGGDGAALAAALKQTGGIVQAFRAAPLSEADQTRRAGQLQRYLSLVPVEYGRGVKQGQVVADLEIQEAKAFSEAARAAYADLRLPMAQRDPAAASAIADALQKLDDAIAATAARAQVADLDAVSRAVAAISAQLQAVSPPEWSRPGGEADFDVVRELLDRVESSVAAGRYDLAESARLEAYAIFETGPEKRLMALAPDAAQRVEQTFWEGDGQGQGLYDALAAKAGRTEVRASRQALDAALADVQQRLGTGVAPAAIVFNAATIVFREGLEAVLILASLLASMVGANRRFKRPLAVGAFGALAVTALLFFLAQKALLSFGQYSEQLEAIVSVIAIGVLLLVMNWFFHKVYWTRWIAHHHERRRRLVIGGVAGQMLGLVVLGFTSVFREGAETVLFLQALVLDAGVATVVQGVALGLAGTAVVGVLTLLLQAKLPHKKMLIVTGMMIALVLVTMVGTTTHTLQLVGWAPITPVHALQGMPYWLGVWFGLYPTWQGIVAQIVAVVFVIGSYFVAERVNKGQLDLARLTGAAGRLLTSPAALLRGPRGSV